MECTNIRYIPDEWWYATFQHNFHGIVNKSHVELKENSGPNNPQGQNPPWLNWFYPDFWMKKDILPDFPECILFSLTSPGTPGFPEKWEPWKMENNITILNNQLYKLLNLTTGGSLMNYISHLQSKLCCFL